MKSLFISSLAFVLLSGITACTKNNTRDDRQQKLQAVIDSVRRSLSATLGVPVPSINVLVQTPTDKYFASAAADASQQITAGTYFRFASNSKNFTATAIMNMYEDGWLNYKAKITDLIPGSTTPYVPATADWDFPNKEIITIEQLLQHSAGVFDLDNDTTPGYEPLSFINYTKKADPAHQFTTDEMVKVLKDRKLSYFAPGTGHHYSNTGFAILARIVQRVYTLKAGKEKTIADYLSDYVTGSTTPVPLSSVHFPVLATDVTLPDPHVIGTELQPQGTVLNDRANMSAHVGEGNGYGTMDDLNRYVRTLMTGKNVLTPATVQLMQKSISPGDATYALGCIHTTNLGYGHNGAILGYLSIMMYDPETDVSLIAMMPVWDLRKGETSFIASLYSLYDAAWSARRVLGYPGKP